MRQLKQAGELPPIQHASRPNSLRIGMPLHVVDPPHSRKTTTVPAAPIGYPHGTVRPGNGHLGLCPYRPPYHVVRPITPCNYVSFSKTVPRPVPHGTLPLKHPGLYKNVLLPYQILVRPYYSNRSASDRPFLVKTNLPFSFLTNFSAFSAFIIR